MGKIYTDAKKVVRKVQGLEEKKVTQQEKIPEKKTFLEKVAGIMFGNVEFFIGIVKIINKNKEKIGVIIVRSWEKVRNEYRVVKGIVFQFLSAILVAIGVTFTGTAFASEFLEGMGKEEEKRQILLSKTELRVLDAQEEANKTDELAKQDKEVYWKVVKGAVVLGIAGLLMYRFYKGEEEVTEEKIAQLEKEHKENELLRAQELKESEKALEENLKGLNEKQEKIKRISTLKAQVPTLRGGEKLEALEELNALRQGKGVPIKSALDWKSLDETIYKENPAEFLKLTYSEQFNALENIKDKSLKETLMQRKIEQLEAENARLEVKERQELKEQALKVRESTVIRNAMVIEEKESGIKKVIKWVDKKWRW